MIKILFICHGNICRSPAAEMILKHMTDRIKADSMATSTEEIGNGLYPPMREALQRRGIPILPHAARQTVREDYERYDHIICMDKANVHRLHIIYGGDPAGKISLLMSWAGEYREVEDPWYTWRFDQVVREIERGCAGIVSSLLR